MRDFLPDDVRKREYVIRVISDVYQRYGFEPLETPAVENIETLLGKYGEEGDRLIFKILKRGEEATTGQADLALRYDLTVPLARVAAEYRASLPKYFKRYQIQPVWRADRPQKGRFREFYQCDVDAIGSRSMVVEAELLAAAADILIWLGFADFRIRLNHRRFLTGFLRYAGLDRIAAGALTALDKLDKIGVEGVTTELRLLGANPSETDKLMRFFADHVPNLPSSANLSTATALADAWQVLGSQDDCAAGLRDLTEIVELAGPTKAGSHLQFDPSLARGLSYYTGSIFEITVPDLAGSLGGGGRYDNLIGMFSGEDVPACGISLGLERILVVMTERNMFPAGVTRTPADVMVTIWKADRTTDAVRLAGELRAAGLRVDVYPEADKLSKQFKYASARGARFVAIVGEDEALKGEVAVKNLTSGEQASVARAHVAEFIKNSA